MRCDRLKIAHLRGAGQNRTALREKVAGYFR